MDAGTGAGGKKAAADAMPWRSNAGKRSVESGEILKYCPLGLEEQEFLEQASEQAGLSMRGCHRVIRVARTIADLEGKRPDWCRASGTGALFPKSKCAAGVKRRGQKGA